MLDFSEFINLYFVGTNVLSIQYNNNHSNKKLAIIFNCSLLIHFASGCVYLTIFTNFSIS